MITIKTPCSSANQGPGFDVIGLALSIYLTLEVSTSDSKLSESAPLNCTLSCSGEGSSSVSLVPDENLITRTALYVLRCHGQRSFPAHTLVHIHNAIPLGRGLGSSGAAVVAGVSLANEVGKLGLARPRMLDYSLMIERHPDNVAAALYGGFVGTYLNDLTPAEVSRKEIPLSEVLPEPAGGIDTGVMPPEPPLHIGHCMKFPWSPSLKAIAVIPDFEVATAKAREVMPSSYCRADVVFNLQRIALLPNALGKEPPDAERIFLAMQDRVHQPYRVSLIPGLQQVLKSMTPKSHPGLCGICLSGARPTILALATENFESIAENILQTFKREGVHCEWRLLQPAEDGTTVRYS